MTPQNALEQIRQDYEFCRTQSRPGKESALMTSLEATKILLDEIDRLTERTALLDWIKEHVNNIDFHISVPKGVMCTNPWIAIGANFEEAIAKARDQLSTAVVEVAKP